VDNRSRSIRTLGSRNGQCTRVRRVHSHSYCVGCDRSRSEPDSGCANTFLVTLDQSRSGFCLRAYLSYLGSDPCLHTRTQQRGQTGLPSPTASQRGLRDHAGRRCTHHRKDTGHPRGPVRKTICALAHTALSPLCPLGQCVHRSLKLIASCRACT